MFFPGCSVENYWISSGQERGSRKEFFMNYPDIHDLLNEPHRTISQLCELNKITQEKLAELAGMSTSQISRMINSKPDSKASTIKKIALVFGLLRKPQ